MPKISIRKIDALFDIAADLEILTYLWTLVQADAETPFFMQSTLNTGKRNAPDYILSLQTEVMQWLEDLLQSDDFLSPSEADKDA